MNKQTHPINALLRGEITAASLLSESSPVRMGQSLLLMIFAAGSLYGACAGLFGILRGTDYALGHLLGVMLKVPLLFLLTLLVTAPSMYVFSALAGIELQFRQMLRLMLAGTALSLVTLASFAPVTAFFTFSTTSYPFMLLLNVTLFALAGLVGVSYLKRNLRPTIDEGSRSKGADYVIRMWFYIYGAVGMQMGWILRPFVGNPESAGDLLRDTQGSVISGIMNALGKL